MQTTSSDLATHLTQNSQTLARLLKITRTDGVVIYLTDHDQDIAYDESVEP